MLMEHCPLFDMVGFRDGVCFLPKDGPYPKGLLLFWAPGKSIFFFLGGRGGGQGGMEEVGGVGHILLNYRAVYC